MSTKYSQTSRSLPVLLFYPVLLLCLSIVWLMVPGESWKDYRYAAVSSKPPGNTTMPAWQENTTGKSLTLPEGSDVFIVRGELPADHFLLVPSFFGAVTAADETPRTNFSGSQFYLLEGGGDVSLRVYLPFLRRLHLRVLSPQQVHRLWLLNRILMGIGAICLLAALIPGPGKPMWLLTGVYLLLSSGARLTDVSLPGGLFTAQLLYLSICPLAMLLTFRTRYGIPDRHTDTLVSFTIAYDVCLIYYHINELSHSLLIFGAGLQAANLIVATHLARQHRQLYAPAAFGALLVTLTAFLGFWLSLAVGMSGSGWLTAAMVTLIAAMLLVRLPAPMPADTTVPVFRTGNRRLHFADFAGRMRRMGFDNPFIERVAHKCNTSNGHMQHVAEYTRVICVAMGFNARKTEQISCAALLHDIGKLEIPDAILFDSGKLSSEAFAQLCTHNRLGYDLLQKREGEFFRLAAEVALQHHERMDGTGYMKLRGDEISLPARIVAVADVFDALTAPRAYKKPWEFETAFSYIVENCDTQFDRTVVADFIKCKDVIRQIYDAVTLSK